MVNIHKSARGNLSQLYRLQRKHWFLYSGFLLGMVSFNHFPFPPSTFCTVCKFMCIFEDQAFIDWMSPFVVSRIQSDWLPSYIPGDHWNGSFALGTFSVQSVVNWIQGLVPSDPCAVPQFHVVRTSGISQTRLHSASRTNAATSHFKLNQVIETWVYQLHPIQLSPSNRVTGLSHQQCCGAGPFLTGPGSEYFFHRLWLQVL